MSKQQRFNQIWHVTKSNVVNQYAKIESERLSFIRNNQIKLRAENYIHLQDVLHLN